MLGKATLAYPCPHLLILSKLNQNIIPNLSFINKVSETSPARETNWAQSSGALPQAQLTLQSRISIKKQQAAGKKKKGPNNCQKSWR